MLETTKATGPISPIIPNNKDTIIPMKTGIRIAGFLPIILNGSVNTLTKSIFNLILSFFKVSYEAG